MALGIRAAAPQIRARRFTSGALRGFSLHLSDGFLQRQTLARDLGLTESRLHTTQLGNQGRACPLIKRAPALAGGTGIQSGDSACYEGIVICHPYPVGGRSDWPCCP